MTEWILGLTCACALLALGLVLLALREQHRRHDELVARVDSLTALLDAGSAPIDDPTQGSAKADGQDFVITALAATSAQPPVSGPRPSTAFVPNATVRETLILGAAWAHGLRRALDPATRNRIRFEMRREIKRARRTRKQEMKQALREFRARERANLGAEEAA